MPRTRRSVLISQENIIEPIEEPKKNRGRPKKRKNSDESEESSPGKSSRSDSLSPTITNQINCLNVSTSRKHGTKFGSARLALHDNSSYRLPGRESQYNELTAFLYEHINNKTSASLYINGPPGTGKTATLMKIVNAEYEKKLKIAFINSTSITSIGAVYKKICNILGLRYDGNGTEKECLSTIEKYFSSTPKKTTLLVLDEIDQLCSSGKNNNILYHIFEWPSIAHSKLILIGIANSLDLTDRLLSRLQSHCELKPKVMHFAAYSKNQIVDILKSRLEETDLFPPPAINFLAAKVAALSGDVRTALNLGKRVVEIAALNKKKNDKALDLKQLEGIIDSESGVKAPSSIEEEPKIQLKEVMSVINNVYGCTQSLGDDIDRGFPLQQKVMISTLLLIIKYDKNKDITIGRLHNIYEKVCKKRNIQSNGLSEFISLCSLAETKGIVRLTTKKEPRFNKIHLQWNEDEVFAALKDKQMITNILNEKSLLTK